MFLMSELQLHLKFLACGMGETDFYKTVHQLFDHGSITSPFLVNICSAIFDCTNTTPLKYISTLASFPFINIADITLISHVQIGFTNTHNKHY